MNRKMKDSGIDWIGKIPIYWDIIRLKYLCNIKTGNQDTQDSVPGGLYPFYVRSPKIERSNKYTFEGSSILMAGDGVGAGKVFHLADGKFGCHQRVYCMRNFKKVNRKIIYYLLQSTFHFSIDSANTKSTVDSVRLPMLLDFPILLSPLEEQQAIIDFLDTKCTEVNEMITLQENMIEELKLYKQSVITEAVIKGINPDTKMKDSGIEGIGKIPNHWDVERLKNRIMLNPPINVTDINDNTIVSFMPMECLRNGIITPRTALYSDVNTYTPFQEQDIVMAKVTPCYENGNIAIATDLKNGIGFGTSEIFVIRCNTNINNNYLFYYLQSTYIKNLGIASMTGTGGLKRVNPSTLYCSRLLCPPTTEQQQIADFLDQKCEQIDQLTNIKQQKIDELKEYKKSIIYEYITGKKQIR